MKNSPIVDKHQGLSAKMADFGGWLMPIEYLKTGAIEEYNSVRNNVGIFDVSHLGKVSVIGKGATKSCALGIGLDLSGDGNGFPGRTTTYRFEGRFRVTRNVTSRCNQKFGFLGV